MDRNTGVRTLISGAGLGSGPALNGPYSIAVEGTGNRTEVFSNRLQTGTTNFDMPYDVVRNACDNSFYVLHTGATGVLGNVMRVNATGTRTLFATYTASSPPSNYSVLMRPLILLPGGGGPADPAEAETSNREGQGGLSRTPRPPWPSPPPSAPACRTAPRPATPDR